VQAAVLFEHGRPIAPRHFVNARGNLDHDVIQCAESIEEFVDIAGSYAVGMRISPYLFSWLGHRNCLFCINGFIAHLGRGRKRKQLITPITESPTQPQPIASKRTAVLISLIKSRSLRPDPHTSPMAGWEPGLRLAAKSLTSSGHRFTNHSRGQGHQDHSHRSLQHCASRASPLAFGQWPLSAHPRG